MKIVTKKGYGFFEATSTFQKAIRRNDEAMALYFMTEFFNSGYEEYLWKRMKIIVSEDIGLAMPGMPSIINALHQNFIDQTKDKKESRPERMFLVHAVLLLCRCKKSRLVDYALIKVWREHDSKEVRIPDYAHDMHTLRGKQLNRGLDHFYEVGAHLENHNELDGEATMKKEALELQRQFPGKLKFDVTKKGTLSQQNILFIEQDQE